MSHQSLRSIVAPLLLLVLVALAACQPMPATIPTVQPTESSISAAVAPTSTPAPAVQVVPVATGFFWPTDIANAGDDRLFVTQKSGQILITQPDGTLAPTPFLDLQSHVLSSGFEQGLFGLVFHPDYATNGYFYVSYTRFLGEGDPGNGDTVVSRFQVTTDANLADPASETILMVVDQPSEFHNGGDLAFGPDGYLYITRGDGSWSGSPTNAAQDKTVLLGKILRIDVNRAEGDLPYGIPPDNPFVGEPGARPEIWAYGFRNPWRISFDRETRDLYIADVGDTTLEEINVQPAGSTGGENYGWPRMEGRSCYPIGTTDCDQSGITLPIFEYPHNGQPASVTGGFVYRGNRFPTLRGYYFFIDYYAQTLWSLKRDEMGLWQFAEWGKLPDPITTFGEGADGELYLGGDDWPEINKGNLYRVEAAIGEQGNSLFVPNISSNSP